MIENIIPAITAIVGMIGGFLLSLLNDWVQRKANAREKFFYEVFPKRLEVYEDVLKYFYNVRNREITFKRTLFSAPEISDAIHTLENLLSRLCIYGSSAASGPLNILFKEMILIHKRILISGDRESRNILAIVHRASVDFTKLVRKETRANFVDKEITKFFGTIKIDEEEGENTPNTKAKQGKKHIH